MKLPNYSVEELSQFRLQECQGTIIGGLVCAIRYGSSAETYGYDMMALQRVDWSRANSAEKIAAVFWQHYQTTYGFGDQLSVEETPEAIVLTMPSLAAAAEYQLNHWAATEAQLNDLQRGYWRAIDELCGVRSKLDFNSRQHRVTLFRS